MKVRWLKSAFISLVEIREFIAVDNPQAADRVTRRVQNIVARLEQFPLSGRVGMISHTREIVITGLPYIIQYRIVKSEIQILRVYHAKRDIG